MIEFILSFRSFSFSFYNFLMPFSCFLFMFHSMFTPIQQSTAWPPLLRRLELLPGVTILFRDHGRPILGTLVTFQLFYLFLLSVEYLNCWSEKNTGKHL